MRGERSALSNSPSMYYKDNLTINIDNDDLKS